MGRGNRADVLVPHAPLRVPGAVADCRLDDRRHRPPLGRRVWTSSARLRQWEPRKIRNLYFYVLAGYSVFGLTMLYFGKPLTLLTIGTNIMNFALGFSCWHVLVLNTTLLPRELRPNWFMRAALFFGGLFFIVLSIIVGIHTIGEFRK